MKPAVAERPASSAQTTDWDENEEYLLLRRYTNGDESAFERLYERHADRLLRYVYKCVGDWQEAEDVVQEVFLQVHKDAGRFLPNATPSTWIFRITTFMCMKRRRDKGIRRRIMDSGIARGVFQPPKPEPAAEEAAVRKETVAAIGNFTASLQEDHKAVLVLRENDGLSYRQIARSLGLHLGTVKSRLSRAREMLRGRLEAEG